MNKPIYSSPLASIFNSLSALGAQRPIVHLQEREEDYLLSVDLPSIGIDDLHIEAKNRILSVLKSSGVQGDDFVLFQCESNQRSFQAQYRNGVLWLRLPKQMQAAHCTDWIDRSRLSKSLRRPVQLPA